MTIHAQNPSDISGNQRCYLDQHRCQCAHLPEPGFRQFRICWREKHLTLKDKAVPHNAHFRPFAENIAEPAEEITAVALQFLNLCCECRIQALTQQRNLRIAIPPFRFRQIKRA